MSSDKDTHDRLERLISHALREQPSLRAPASLEARVLAAIESRRVVAGWRAGFTHWPVFARALFILASIVFVRFALLALDGAVTVVDSSSVFGGFFSQLAWMKAVAELIASGLRGIPEHWFWGAAGLIAMLYGMFFAIGAFAYRALYARS